MKLYKIEKEFTVVSGRKTAFVIADNDEIAREVYKKWCPVKKIESVEHYEEPVLLQADEQFTKMNDSALQQFHIYPRSFLERLKFLFLGRF